MSGSMDRVFWSGDIGFVVDVRARAATRLPASVSFKDAAIADELEESGRLPGLGEAPVASWMIARLLEITRGGIGFDEHEDRFGDGGCVHLNWIALSRDLKPIAIFDLLCYTNRIVLDGQVLQAIGEARLRTAFLDALLKCGDAVRVCQISITDTDPPTAPGRLGRKYVFGFDGQKYLGTREYE